MTRIEYFYKRFSPDCLRLVHEFVHIIKHGCPEIPLSSGKCSEIRCAECWLMEHKKGEEGDYTESEVDEK